MNKIAPHPRGSPCTRQRLRPLSVQSSDSRCPSLSIRVNSTARPRHPHLDNNGTRSILDSIPSATMRTPMTQHASTYRSDAHPIYRARRKAPIHDRKARLAPAPIHRHHAPRVCPTAKPRPVHCAPHPATSRSDARPRIKAAPMASRPVPPPSVKLQCTT